MVILFQLFNETKTVRGATRFSQEGKIIPKKNLCRNAKQASTSARRSWICHQAVLSIFEAICVKFALKKFSKKLKKLVVRGKLWKMTNRYLPEKKTMWGEYCLQIGQLVVCAGRPKMFSKQLCLTGWPQPS